MAAFPFEVEFVDEQGRFVLVRQLEGGAFRLAPGARLADCEVGHVSQPQALAADGSPRLDLFLFRLERPADRARFRVGERVVLQTQPSPKLPPTS